MTAGAMLPEVVSERAGAALRPGVVHRRDVELARTSVRIEAEESVAPFVLAPFAHLVTAARPPQLHVRVAAMRDSDGDLRNVPESGIVRTSDDGQTITHLLPDSVAVYRRREGTLDALLRDTGGSASWRRAKPLQLLLSVFCSDHGVDLIHAGAVSLGGRGVLFAGGGGSGKSTSSLACLLAGIDFLGDDCVGLREVGDHFEVCSVFGSGCLDREHRTNFPALQSGGPQFSSDGKEVLPIAQQFAGRMVPAATIRAVVLPRVTHADDVTIHPVPKAEAMLALAPSSILKRAVPAAAAFARIARLVRSVPAYRLEMGPVDAIGPRVRELLETLR